MRGVKSAQSEAESAEENGVSGREGLQGCSRQGRAARAQPRQLLLRERLNATAAALPITGKKCVVKVARMWTSNALAPPSEKCTLPFQFVLIGILQSGSFRILLSGILAAF